MFLRPVKVVPRQNDAPGLDGSAPRVPPLPGKSRDPSVSLARSPVHCAPRGPPRVLLSALPCVPPCRAAPPIRAEPELLLLLLLLHSHAPPNTGNATSGSIRELEARRHVPAFKRPASPSELSGSRRTFILPDEPRWPDKPPPRRGSRASESRRKRLYFERRRKVGEDANGAHYRYHQGQPVAQ